MQFHYTCDKQVLWESAGAFFPRDNSLARFTRQVAHFTRSWSSDKMLAFQPRGFMFEPVGMCLFFYKYSEAEGSHIFRHYETFRLCETFFEIFLMSPKSPPFIFFQYFATERMLKIPKGPFFQNFRHYETVQNSRFLFFFENFKRLHSHFFQKLSMSTKGPPFSLLDILQQNDVKKSQRVPFFQIFWHNETAIKASHFLSKKDSKESPSIF